MKINIMAWLEAVVSPLIKININGLAGGWRLYFHPVIKINRMVWLEAVFSPYNEN